MLITTDSLKYRSVLIFCHFLLSNAEREYVKGNGIKCLTNERKMRRLMKYICRKLESLGCTKAFLQKQAKPFPYVPLYFDKVSSIYQKSFKVKDEHIPAMFVLEVLRLYSEKGFPEFKKLDFLRYQGYFESYHDKKFGLIPKHFDTALKVVNGMDAFSHKRKK